MKEKKNRNTRAGGREGKAGAEGGEGKTVEGVDNRSRASSSGSLGSLNSVVEESAGVLPVVDDLDNLDWEPDDDVGDGAAKTTREPHRSKGDYLAHFKVRHSNSFVPCVLKNDFVGDWVRS